MKILRTIILCVCVAAIAVGGIFACRNCNSGFPAKCVAYAEEQEQYSDPLADLKKDDSFKELEYPVNDEDYSVNVIQIAESLDGDLLLYVYVPNTEKDIIATSVNISWAINENLSYKNYTVTLLSKNGVFHKYLVNDFALKPDALRYYDISSLFRKWDESIDDNPYDENGNTILEVSYGVEKLFTATTLNGAISYSCVYSETVLITAKYVGMVRYSNGWAWITHNNTDSHYVAFSTDHDIERLMEADVEFVTVPTRFISVDGKWSTTEGESENKAITLLDDMNGSNKPQHLFGKKYEWKRIQSAAEFIADPQTDLTDAAKEAVSDMQWVLRFHETNYTYSGGAGIIYWDQTRVSDVTILRLKFQTDGKTYNLGAVDNKQTGKGSPDNTNTDETNVGDFFDKARDFFKKLGAKISDFFSKFPKLLKWFKTYWKWIVLVVVAVLIAGIFIRVIKWITG